MFERHALFYTPPPGPWADFCAAWLGWDSVNGCRVEHPDIAGLDIAALTQTPRKYGIHATMKAPFHLARDAQPQDLEQAMVDLAQALRPVVLEGMELSTLKGFVALTPVGDVAALQDLETQVVQKLDTFRAPLSEEALAKRRATPLTAQQDQYLIDWGYPFVMDQFRFHITLTERLTDDMAAKVLTALNPVMTPLLPIPFQIDHLTLMGQDGQGMFHHIHRYALTG